MNKKFTANLLIMDKPTRNGRIDTRDVIENVIGDMKKLNVLRDDSPERPVRPSDILGQAELSIQGDKVVASGIIFNEDFARLIKGVDTFLYPRGSGLINADKTIGKYNMSSVSISVRSHQENIGKIKIEEE